MSYMEKTPFDTRQKEASKIREKYPGRIPVIIEKVAKSDVPDIDKNKYLVPCDLTLGQFVYVIRRRLSLSPEKALFIFVNNTLVTTGTLMREIYGNYASEDGFLYMHYAGESTFGSAACV